MRIEISLIELPLSSGQPVPTPRSSILFSVFSVFNDSSPVGWSGDLLLDRTLEK